MSRPKDYEAYKKNYMAKIDEVIANGRYKDTWESLGQMNLPRWWEQAKFGIFIHWGVYSVPAFRNEWYSRNMYIQGTDEFKHHVETYGPHKEFGYKDFIPMFKAEHWDPKAWAALFAEAGARYVVPVAEHHDGFQMYASDLSDWNAAEMGPHRNVVGELKAACEAKGITFCTSTHRAEHYFFMGNGRDFESDIHDPMQVGDFYWPSVQEQPDQGDRFASPYPTQEFLDDWILRTCELIDRYQPKILYFDWWIMHEGYKAALRKITAYYYNRGLEWGYETAVCYKHDAMSFGTGIVDVERGKFADVKPYHWQTDTAIAHNSWCYTTELDYKTPRDILCYLVDVVAKNGNLLLNVGPRADGTIPEEDTHILKEIGRWLKTNGEAVYGSRVWRYAAEGPTKESEGKFSEGNADGYTREDFRFTCGNGAIYAFAMAWPVDGRVKLHSLACGDANSTLFQGILRRVEILGYDGPVEWSSEPDGLVVSAPGVAASDVGTSGYPVVLKIVTD